MVTLCVFVGAAIGVRSKWRSSTYPTPSRRLSSAPASKSPAITSASSDTIPP